MVPRAVVCRTVVDMFGVMNRTRKCNNASPVGRYPLQTPPRRHPVGGARGVPQWAPVLGLILSSTIRVIDTACGFRAVGAQTVCWGAGGISVYAHEGAQWL